MVAEPLSRTFLSQSVRLLARSSLISADSSVLGYVIAATVGLMGGMAESLAAGELALRGSFSARIAAHSGCYAGPPLTPVGAPALPRDDLGHHRLLGPMLRTGCGIHGQRFRGPSQRLVQCSSLFCPQRLAASDL